MNEQDQYLILLQEISKRFNGADVSDIIIDDEFGNVTATVNNVTNVGCGFIEDYPEASSTENKHKKVMFSLMAGEGSLAFGAGTLRSVETGQRTYTFLSFGMLDESNEIGSDVKKEVTLPILNVYFKSMDSIEVLEKMINKIKDDTRKIEEANNDV